MTNEHWHLDKRVSVSVMTAIAIQTISIVWMASALNAKVDNNAEAILRLATEVDSRRHAIDSNTIGVALMSQQLSDLKELAKKSSAELTVVGNTVARIEERVKEKK